MPKKLDETPLVSSRLLNNTQGSRNHVLPALALRKSADLAQVNRRRNTKIEVPQSTFTQLTRNKEPLIKSFANVNLATGDNIAQEQFRRDLSVCFSNLKTMPRYTRNRILARVTEMEKAATH
jgi:hypothetical protein